jgi:hypothetical protein
VARLGFYSIRITGDRLYWRVAIPGGPIGYRHISFKRKAKAQAFYRACKKELARVKKIDFLISSHKLIDAIEALRALEGVDKGPWQNRLRRSAALYALCEGEAEKEPEDFIEPTSRCLELPPQLYRGLARLAREKNASSEDLVVSLLWQYLREESEKKIRVYKNEEKIPLRCLL